MSGIGGLATSDLARIPGEEPLLRLAAALRHRGPDGMGTHRGPGIGLAACRHAADGTLPASRPVLSFDEDVFLAWDGAATGARRLRKDLASKGHRFSTDSAVEAVIGSYLERGLDFLHSLRGFFALALWDARERRLVLARDRLGIRSLVYAETPGGLAFASEAKGLLAAGWVEARPDAAAIDELFRFGAIHAPRTAFEGVRMLLPGERLVYHAGSTRLERWWDLGRESVDSPRSAAGWAEGLRERLAGAVRGLTEDAESVTAWLSGGLDSSAVSALAAGALSDPLETLTLAFDDPDYDEAAGGTLADHAEYRLKPLRATVRDADFADLPRAIWHTEVPAVWAIEVPRLVMARASGAAGHRVALSGEGADAVLGGGWWVPLDLWFRPPARLPRWLRRAPLIGPLTPGRHPRGARAWLAPAGPVMARYEALVGLAGRARRGALYSPEFRRRVDESVRRGPAVGESLPAVPDGIALSPVEYVHVKLHLPDFTLLKVERTALAFGIDVRLPFLDHEVVEYAARIPSRLKLRPWSRKDVLRRAMRGILPEDLRRRPKRGLAAPIGRWLRQPLPDQAAALLSPGSLRAKGYFDPREIGSRLVDRRQATLDVGQLVGVLTVQMWDDLFVSGPRPWRDAADRGPAVH
ncbi:MAG TPA: asparagine synthase (glutamine-hydrolyzing) [Gemmatimonadota bacterium]